MKKMMSGKYWIGDPCYVLGSNSHSNFDWYEFCNFMFKDDPSGRKNEGIINHQNIIFSVYGTAYGDGDYSDNDGNRYGVDSGCLACIPIESINVEDFSLGHIYDFPTDFETSYNDGKIRFGDVVINTSDEYDDEEDDYDEEDEER